MYTITVDGISEDEAVDLGSAADEIYELSLLRRDVNKIEKQATSRMTYLKRYILDNLPDENLTGVQGKLATASSVIKEVPVVADWDVFYQYITTNNRMDLLQKRLQTRSCMETLTEGDKIPGVKITELLDLSIRKNR